MLNHLKIQNYALIQHLSINFRENLNILTGETGAGKSIILGALGLVQGKRADTSVLFNPEAKCIVEATFHVKGYKLEPFFSQNELDYDELTLIRREISPSGKSRAFINDTPVTLSQLKELSGKLLDIHSQHQSLLLDDGQFRLSVVDVLAQNHQRLQEYSSLFAKWQKIQKHLNNLKAQEEQLQRDQDYYLFQLQEISEAGFSTDEQTLLEEELQVLSNAENIKSVIEKLFYLIYEGEANVSSLLTECSKSIKEIRGINTLDQLAERLDGLAIESKDIYNELKTFDNTVFVDNERLEEVEERLNLLNKLCHKHKVSTVGELLSYAHELEEKTSHVNNLGIEIKQVEKELQAVENELHKQANDISALRGKEFPSLEKTLRTLLRQVGIPDAEFKVTNQKQEKLTGNGYDKIEFMFSANKGTPVSPVGQSASGGELSRIMLCLKYLVSGKTALPTILFDEIDAGISGEVAIKVGRMIRQISANHQVMCITHMPQIAAMGKYHYLVYKQNSENYTYTYIKELPEIDREIEIAKMIAGNNPSETALLNARELMLQVKE